MASIDENNYAWFKKNLSDLLKEYAGQFIVVYEQSMRGAYSSFEAALAGALEFAKPGEFLIQRCVSEEESTQVICSLIKMPQLV